MALRDDTTGELIGGMRCEQVAGMQVWNRANTGYLDRNRIHDGVHAMAVLRNSLDAVVARSYRGDITERRGGAYQPDRHNLALAIVDYVDGASRVLASTSEQSQLPIGLVMGFELVPSTYREIEAAMGAATTATSTQAHPHVDLYGCKGGRECHTEPKLLN